MEKVSIQFPARMRPIAAACECFLLHLYSHSDNTQDTYKYALEQFSKAMPEGLRIDEITSEHIERHLAESRKTHAATSCNIYLAAIKSLFNWLEEFYGLRNPAKKIKQLKTLPPYRRNLTVDEYNQVIKSTTGYMRDTIRLMAMIGIRASEVIKIREENIQGDFLVFVGKGSKQCYSPLNSVAKSILASPGFLNFLKNRNRRWLIRLCHRASKIAGLERTFSPHDLRHFYANQLHRSRDGKPGLPIETISHLMNHSSPAVTALVYIEWSREKLADKTEKLAHLSE